MSSTPQATDQQAQPPTTEAAPIFGPAAAGPYDRPAVALPTDLPGQPLVSILILTHNRPDYAELALRSALAQSYGHIEIIVSDNSDDERTRLRFLPYLEAHPNIGYYRIPGASAMENGMNCYRRARGSYINYLMDDDLLHADKIATMLPYLETMPNIGLVTSARQLINAQGGNIVPTPEQFLPLCDVETVIGGRSLGLRLLTSENVIGEPTTVLFRRAAAGKYFGFYCGKQFTVLSDVANWLAILTQFDCVYLPQPLSYFRIHGEQHQRQTWTQVYGHLEGLELFCTAFRQGHFIDRLQGSRNLLAQKMIEAVTLFAQRGDLIREAAPDQAALHRLMRYASETLLLP